jgi:hypothetical protein
MRNFVDQQNYGTYSNRVKLNTFCSKELGNKKPAGVSHPSSLILLHEDT